MKRAIPLLLCCAAVVLGQSTVWRLDPPHSAAQFSVRHMGIATVRGTFTKVHGTVTYDPADLSMTAIDVTIDAPSVDSRVEMRDNDLRSDHFLDVQKYPTITFKSKSAEPAGQQTESLRRPHDSRRDQTRYAERRGTSQPIKDPRGNTHMGASATTIVNRSDFGMTFMQAMVGNEVNITIDVELVNGDLGMRPGGPGAPGGPGMQQPATPPGAPPAT